MLRYIFNRDNSRAIKGYRDLSLKEKVEIRRCGDSYIFADVLELHNTILGIMANLKLYYPDGSISYVLVNICCDNPLSIIDVKEPTSIGMPLELFNGMFNS